MFNMHTEKYQINTSENTGGQDIRCYSDSASMTL